MTPAVDTLFVAMTRPSVKWGVPFEGFAVNFVVTSFLTMLVIHRPWGFAIGVAVHFGMRELCRVDPHFFRRWSLYFQTKARSLTKHLWGGSRLQPSQTWTHKAIDMRSSI
jgi:type IV secretion system protein VirB3